jgi:hypothetical protein
MRATAICLLALSTTLVPGCIEPDLGDVPFFCNTGDPKCPDGYECIAGQCVLEGLGAAADAAPGIADRGSATGDQAQPSDGPAPVKWDLGATHDSTPTPMLDTGGAPPVSGCLTDSDCSTQAPCCCLGTCEVICLFTFCFP